MKKIDAWEQLSIDKIHQAANNARKELLTILGTHRNKVTNDLTYLTQELSKARNEDDYVETDLKEWMGRLDKLKTNLTAAQTIDFGQDNSGSALISKILINGVSTEVFEQTIGDIKIIENGTVVVHGQSKQNASVRGRGKYSSGQHRLRFQMEQYSGTGDFACGILSKTMSVETLMYISNNNNMFGNDYGALRAQNNNGLFYFTNHNQYTENNDIAELLVDYDRQTIRFTNERTHQRQELKVNLATYPFPWQFFITLSYPNDRVCLCEEKR